MEFKGTKGEWMIKNESNDLETVVMVNNTRICEVKHYPNRIGEWEKDPTKKEGKSNAQLISCAPQMLEILNELVELKQLKFNDGEYPSKEYLERKPIAWEKAKEIVKKATTI